MTTDSNKENYTYVIGENTTLNAIIPKMEKFWGEKVPARL